MKKKYSIAEARHNLAAIVKELEQQPVIQITRRNQPVALLVSTREYERLSSSRSGFWEAYIAYREQVDLVKDSLDENTFENLRSKESGREVDI